MAITFLPLTKKVALGGREFILSALPVGLLRTKYIPVAEQLAKGQTQLNEAMDEILNLVRTSLSCADPSITVEDLENGLVMADLLELFAAVGDVSGMSRKDASEGEAPSPESSTGTVSTGS